MKTGHVLALAATLMLTAGTATAVQTSGTTSTKPATQSITQEKATSTVHHETGTISSMTGTEMVLAHEWRGKEEKTKFTLDSNTKKDGSIAQGERVTVYYRHEKGERLATEVKPSEAKPKTATKKS